MREVGVGLLGLGTVGAGVADVLLRNGDLLAERVGLRLVLRRVAELSAERRRTMPAENHTDIFFEASVGGGIPLIRSVRDGLVADRIHSMYGILNGTCNYILTSMEHTGQSFDEALQAAQSAGYAEADPALDIDGLDTAHKAVVLASLAFGQPVPLEAVSVEGISRLAATDVEYAHDLGYCIRLLAVVLDAGKEIEVRVHPALVPSGHILASVDGVFNALLIDSDGAGEVLLYGRGAGREPTASAVVGNLADAARNLAAGDKCRVPLLLNANPRPIRHIGETVSRYYMRLTLLDRPGVFGEIGAVLGRHGISIASLLQKEDCAGAQVPVIIITHQAPERAFRQAIAEIDAMPIVGDATVRMRIVDEA
ncbi:MAG: homoserine dehydrogenase [Lentisphaerae bacterium]|nr:homoserine dehydrogenase [Lentisphaerota bacterium]